MFLSFANFISIDIVRFRWNVMSLLLSSHLLEHMRVVFHPYSRFIIISHFYHDIPLSPWLINRNELSKQGEWSAKIDTPAAKDANNESSSFMTIVCVRVCVKGCHIALGFSHLNSFFLFCAFHSSRCLIPYQITRQRRQQQPKQRPTPQKSQYLTILYVA